MSAKRLYRVEIEYLAYVMAESDRDAIDKAKYGIRRDYQDPDCESADEITGPPKYGLEAQWRTALPYGSDDDDDERTVGEIVEELKRAAGAKEIVP